MDLEETLASPAENEDVVVAPVETEVAQVEDAKPAAAEPSAAEDKPDAKEAKPKTTEELVRDVLKSPAKPGKSSDPVEPKQEKTAEPKAKEKPTDEKLPPFHKHPDWQKKVKQVDTLNRAVEQMKPDAESHRKTVAFMNEHGLSAEDSAKMFIIAALVKNAPERAEIELQKLLDHVQTRVGTKLPDDIKAAVEAGEITEEKAIELSRARARAANAEEKAATEKQRGATLTAETQAKEQAKMVGSTISDWEATKKQSDPDFARKQALFESAVAASVSNLRARGKSTFTPDEVRTILDQSYAKVNAELKSFVTPKPPVKAPLKALSSVHAQPNAPAGKKPSTLDIVKASLSG